MYLTVYTYLRLFYDSTFTEIAWILCRFTGVIRTIPIMNLNVSSAFNAEENLRKLNP